MKNNQLLKLWAVILILGFVLVCNISLAATTPQIKINNNSSSTKIRKVTLSLFGTIDIRKMIISNKVDFSGAKWESFVSSKIWYLDYGNGTKTVYVKYKDKKGKISEIYKDTILLNAPTNMNVDFEIKSDSEDKDGLKQTNKRYINLKITWSDGVEKMRISNTSDFSNSEWIWVDNNISWTLLPDSGEKTVYIEFKDANEGVKVVSKKVNYNQPKHYIPEGSLLKGQSSTVYYLGYDGNVHPFFNGAIYHSWFSNFNEIKYVSNIKLSEYKIGSPVCIRHGTWLVKFSGSPSVYAVEFGCQLKLIRSEGEAIILYGSRWMDRILELDMILKSFYSITYPEILENGIDKDKDGISKEIEDDYGTSDSLKDSDSDGLSDYEEIYYWFSDPNDKDSDGDTFDDGLEVSRGYSPVGVKKITTTDEGTYEYPDGTILFAKDIYFLVYDGGGFKYISQKISDDRFSSNKFQTKFLVKPEVSVPFSYSTSNMIGKAENKITKPQVRTKKGNLINL